MEAKAIETENKEAEFLLQKLPTGGYSIVGLGVTKAVADWVYIALSIRIGDRAADGEEQEAATAVTGILRALVEETAHTIAIQRRQATVEREMRRTCEDKCDQSRRRRVKRILAGKSVELDTNSRGGAKRSQFHD